MPVSGIITIFGISDPIHIAYFEEDATAETICLAAAAIWRVPITPARWTVRRLLRRLRAYFGPLGIGLHLKWNFRPWTGSAGANGEQETLYDPERRIVRVLGQDYSLPEDDQTLVLLIDERTNPTKRASVVLRRVAVPAVARESESVYDPQEPISPWVLLLQQDPVIRDFMAVPPHST
jgi:hypothetical protein